jgi:hypothetical protein
VNIASGKDCAYQSSKSISDESPTSPVKKLRKEKAKERDRNEYPTNLWSRCQVDAKPLAS